MNKNYEEVPNIISCKDLDYLTDMFHWNYGIYKATNNSINEVEDEEVKNMLTKASNTFHGAMTEVLNILNGGYNNEQ